jgi:hypothetical protein
MDGMGKKGRKRRGLRKEGQMKITVKRKLTTGHLIIDSMGLIYPYLATAIIDGKKYGYDGPTRYWAKKNLLNYLKREELI